MKTKEGFARLTVMIPKDHYNLIWQRKLLNGTSMSQTIVEILEHRQNSGKR